MKRRIDELAALMEEFGLEEAKLEGEDWKVEFRRSPESDGHAQEGSTSHVAPTALVATDASAERPTGTPVTSPMNGIYYSTPSPSAPPFVSVGETVTAGQVVALIEAMKVFNEITAPISGRVSRVVAENNQLVLPGDALMYIE